MKESMMPLTLAPHNQDLKILKIYMDDKTKHHLDNLGILVGATLQSISDISGNLILKVKDGKVAINRDVANKIYVAV